MRHLKDILLEKATKITDLGKDGTYIGAHFSKETTDKLKALAKELKIDNVVPREKMHVTIVYSRKPFTNFQIKGKMKEAWKGKPEKLEIFPTQSGSRALVLRFDCPELTERHWYFRNEHGATYDYDEYKVHATLSYDVGKEWQIPKDLDIGKFVDSIEIDEEYYEPLNLDWAKGSDDKKDDKGKKDDK